MSELPDNNVDEARRVLGQAMDELQTARHLAGSSEYPGRIACFLAHLAAEKAIKALLTFRELPYRRIHDLVELVRLLPSDDQYDFAEVDLESLNRWSLDGRYPDVHIDASAETTVLVLEAAEYIVTSTTTTIREDNPYG
jgi:HEPN domain-containing protein